MLKSKSILINWNSNNKKYYESLGYTYTYRGQINVLIEHLPKYSKAEIKVECDYCHNIFYNQFKDYISKKDNLINKDCCYNCTSLKMKEIRDYKQNNNLMDRNDNGYWSYKENRLIELERCIKQYGKLDDINESNKDYRVIASFRNYHHPIEEAIKELGYNIDDVMNTKPNGYFDNINNIIIRIQSFIDIYDRFPTTSEIYINLGIGSLQLQKHGGIFAIKRYMNYSDKYDLKDDNDFYNASTYEYIIAQWLINNKISYKRDQHPFPKYEGKYMSDFTLYLKNDTQIHVEVWGGEGQEHYDKVKETKLELYKKYNINLISIGSDVFLYFNLDKIQNILSDLFSPLFNHTLSFVSEKTLMPSINMTDDELLEELMIYSDDDNYLPQRKILTLNKKARLYDEVKRRYGSYYEFAQKYNKLVYRNRGYWDEEKILDVFNEIMDRYNKLSEMCIKDYMNHNVYLHNFLDIITRHGGLIELKLLFFRNNIYKLKLSQNELKFVRNVVQRDSWRNVIFSPKQKQIAKDILISIN